MACFEADGSACRARQNECEIANRLAQKRVGKSTRREPCRRGLGTGSFCRKSAIAFEASTYREAFLFWRPPRPDGSGTFRGQRGNCIGTASLVLSAFPERIGSLASLESHYGSFRIVFRFGGQKYGRSL